MPYATKAPSHRPRAVSLLVRARARSQIMVPWMLAQWEEFHTGVMMYGNACYGVLEANYSICAVHLLSAALGLRFWRAELTLPAPLSHALQALAGLGAGSGAGAGAGQVLVAAHGNGTLGYAGGAAAAGGGVEPPLLRATVAEVALVVVGLAGVLQGVSNVARVFASPPLPPQVRPIPLVATVSFVRVLVTN